MKAIIIGAGMAGLASAVRMACRGYKVEVFEANDYPGGKLSEIRQDGYRFDAGPSLFTMPMYVDELFEIAGKDPKQYFDYVQLDEICHYFWEDGTRLTAFADREKLGEEVEAKLGVDADKVLRYLDSSKLKYELTGKIFLENSLHKWKTWWSKDVAKALSKLHKLDLFSSMHQVNRRSLQHPKLVQFFDRFATYNGSNPYKAPGLLSIIPHFEQGFGAYFPKGGMYAITKGIYKLAKELGVQFTFNTRVDEILVEEGVVKGVRVGERAIHSDLVISNMDVFFTYKQLLPKEKHPRRILKQEKSTSALIFYWGIKDSFKELGLHNILFSDDYQTEFDHLVRGTIHHDPTVYINISQKYHTADAPGGCENWFTMINVPYDSGQDWDRLIEEARQNIISKLTRMLGRPIAPLIENESILDPRTIQAKTASHLGSLYGTSSNNKMAAFMRHPNFSNKIKNLYFSGGSVHPGGGIPLALLSAKIVDELVEA